MKKFIFLLILILTFTINFTYANDKLITVNPKSTVTVNFSANNFEKIKIGITKDQTTYYYNLNNKTETYPLQMGNGKYSLTIYKHVNENNYKLVETTTFNNESKKNDVFLSSSQNVFWKNSDKVANLAKNLTKDLETDKEKFKAIYNYVTKSIKYDYNKASNVKSSYIPNLKKILESKDGICYDYSSLLAAMLRSQNIPTKLVKGTSTNTNYYHAWNEVYLNGQWFIVDTTIDASNNISNIFKNSSNYFAEKIY